MTNQQTALYVGLRPGNRNYLLHRGYVHALQRAGWTTTWLSHDEGRNHKLESFDFILWDGVIPEDQLGRITPSQRLVLLGGIGDNLSHYFRHPENISLIASSHYYLDEPATNLTWQHMRWDGIRTGQVYYITKYARRFRRNASPSTWNASGIRFLYLPFASDPDLFYPIHRTKDLRWGFAGNLRGRLFLHQLIGKSQDKRWPYEVCAPQTNTQIDPLNLNELYGRMEFGINEQHLMTFGRELNQRSFDLGMAGLAQLTDVGHLASRTFGKFCTCYSQHLSCNREIAAGLNLAEQMAIADPDEVHTFFREHHSFDARLHQIGNAIGVDFTGHGRARTELCTAPA
jgi:hypothetical protein